ncbi:hypothetical protein, partial [Lactobacillus nasalidis]|uniref:hypothetical protein n=1 Tax=Lactobacillus nasalidis TaxID=2797258 RepID=UPI001B7D8E87
ARTLQAAQLATAKTPVPATKKCRRAKLFSLPFFAFWSISFKCREDLIKLKYWQSRNLPCETFCCG